MYTVARLIVSDSDSSDVKSGYLWWHVAAVGATIGVLYWLVTIAAGQFLVDPLFCGSRVNAEACAQSVTLSGNIASIIVAVIGVGALVRLRTARPLLVAIAAAVLLWGLSGWTEGLAWGEIVFWSVLLYGLAYSLFAWVSRYSRSLPVVIWTVIIIGIARIIIQL